MRMNISLLALVLGTSCFVVTTAKDRCGCQSKTGWSSTFGMCKEGSRTDGNEVCRDRCNCVYPQGWSKTSKRCKDGSVTNGSDGDCSGNQRWDRCGCRNGQGWSSGAKKCRSGSVTQKGEDCIDRCGCEYPKGWSSSSNRCRSFGKTESNDRCGGPPPSSGKCPACPDDLPNPGDKGIGACAITRNDREIYFIIMKRDGQKGRYDLPGGTQDGGESRACVAFRETCEETGFIVDVVKKMPGSNNVFECKVTGSVDRNPEFNGKWVDFDDACDTKPNQFRDEGHAWDKFYENVVEKLC